MRIVGLHRQAVDDQTRHGRCPHGLRFHFADVGADHHARQRGRGLFARIAGRDLLAAAQNRRGVAQPFHFIEFVRDVEQAAAFASQPFEHDEKLVGFLRRQHRGRLVEDQQFRILHQRAHDLDALALADRQPPHFAFGIERQAVIVGYLRQPRRHGGKALFAVEPERHVFGNGEIVEQREMLEHHADALGAGFRGSRQDDLVPHPAQFAGGRLDQAVHHFDQRRFAGAVLAQQSVDFAGEQVDADVVVGGEVTVLLGDPDSLQQRCFRRGTVRRLWIQHDEDGLGRISGHLSGVLPLHDSFKPILCQFAWRQKPPISGSHCLFSRHLIAADGTSAMTKPRQRLRIASRADESFCGRRRPAIAARHSRRPYFGVGSRWKPGNAAVKSVATAPQWIEFKGVLRAPRNACL